MLLLLFFTLFYILLCYRLIAIVQCNRIHSLRIKSQVRCASCHKDSVLEVLLIQDCKPAASKRARMQHRPCQVRLSLENNKRKVLTHSLALYRALHCKVYSMSMKTITTTVLMVALLTRMSYSPFCKLVNVMYYRLYRPMPRVTRSLITTPLTEVRPCEK